jgi:excisionase family DNA binding protein
MQIPDVQVRPEPLLPDPEIQPTVSVDVAAKAMGVNRKTYYDGIKRGELPGIVLGRRVVVPTAPLRARLGLDPVSAA